MKETLYPHEIIIRFLQIPNTFAESLMWLIYGYCSLIITYFTACAFGYMVTSNKIIEPIKNQDVIIFGLNVISILCIVLMCFGIIGMKRY